MPADAIPYDGPTQLTDDEQATVVNFLKDTCTDLTMGMLYLMVEGFGWRPGAFVGRDALPDESEMAEFYAYCMGDDPDGMLTISLDLLCAAPDGTTDLTIENLDLIVRRVRRRSIDHNPGTWDGRHYIAGACPICGERHGGRMVVLSDDSQECDTCEQTHTLAVRTEAN